MHKYPRYRSSDITKNQQLDVLFWGGVAGARDPSNPAKTDVKVRYAELANDHVSQSTWIQKWEVKFGSPAMPSGPWNGVSIACIYGSRLFIGLSNAILELDPSDGKVRSKNRYGNTPICQIGLDRNRGQILLQYSYYKFDVDRYGSNLIAVSPNGRMKWSADLPSQGDLFCNHFSIDGDNLVCSTWNCFSCKIGLEEGNLIEKQFTK